MNEYDEKKIIEINADSDAGPGADMPSEAMMEVENDG